MNNYAILAATGGLPPSAFSLSTDSGFESGGTQGLNDQLSFHSEPFLDPAVSSIFGQIDLVKGEVSNFSSSTPLVPTLSPQNVLVTWQQQISNIQMCPGTDMIEALDHTPEGQVVGNRSSTSSRALPRARPSKSAKQTLIDYFRAEVYPDKREIDSIARQTKISFKQVRQWFRNKRRRTSPEEFATMHEQASKTSLPLTVDSLEALDLGTGESSSRSRRSSDCSDFIVRLRTKSVHSVDSVHSGASRMTVRTNNSHRSARSYSSRISKRTYSKPVKPNHRKGRKLFTTKADIFEDRTAIQPPLSGPHDGGTNIAADRSWLNDGMVQKLNDMTKGIWDYSAFICYYYCTFCWEPFKSAFAWARHELEAHVGGTYIWRCGPPEHSNALRAPCLYCCSEQKKESCPINTYLPYSARLEHVQSHNHYKCAEKPERERSFQRAEHLIQHLRLVHKVSDQELRPSSLDSHRVRQAEPTDAEELWCPFCGMAFETWQLRKLHLTEHYRSLHAMGPHEVEEMARLRIVILAQSYALAVREKREPVPTLTIERSRIS